MVDPLIGAVVRSHRLEELIGEGGMAAVYRAVHVDLGTVAAVKVLFPSSARQEELRDRFLQEAQLQAQLQHANIVRVFDVLTDPSLPALVMEYVEGASLEAVLTRRGRLGWEEASEVFGAVLDAVGYAHERGVVHRDIKPANVLLTASGQVKVTDFGLARVMGGSRKTRTGTSMGTPSYMSPEQVLGAKDLDHRTDIYSLGATLFEMVTGSPPYGADGTGDSDFAIKTAHVQAPIPDAREREPSVPAHVAAALTRALAKRPGGRFASCAELARALDGPAARPDPPPRPLPRPEAAPPSLSAAPDAGGDVAGVFVGVLILAGMAAVALGGWPGEGASPARQPTAAALAPEDPAASVAPAAEPPAAAPVPAGWVRIEGGSFEMGSPSSEKGRDGDEVQHRVTITRPYLLKTTEVTQGEWRAVMGSNPSHLSSCGDACPVEQVSWWDALAWCNGRSALEGLTPCYAVSGCTGTAGGGCSSGSGGCTGDYQCTSVSYDAGCTGYRLPTEAEWEYAARGGTTGARYGALDDVAWHGGNSARRTHPVGGLSWNPWGCRTCWGTCGSGAGTRRGTMPPARWWTPGRMAQGPRSASSAGAAGASSPRSFAPRSATATIRPSATTASGSVLPGPSLEPFLLFPCPVRPAFCPCGGASPRSRRRTRRKRRSPAGPPAA